MKKQRGIFILIAACLSIALYNSVSQPISTNSIEKNVSQSYLEEEHNLVGDLELKDQNRTHSVSINNFKNFISQFQSVFITDNTFYNLQVKWAKGFLLLKKHLSLIYVFHNFW